MSRNRADHHKPSVRPSASRRRRVSKLSKARKEGKSLGARRERIVVAFFQTEYMVRRSVHNASGEWEKGAFYRTETDRNTIIIETQKAFATGDVPSDV